MSTTEEQLEALTKRLLIAEDKLRVARLQAVKLGYQAAKFKDLTLALTEQILWQRARKKEIRKLAREAEEVLLKLQHHMLSPVISLRLSEQVTLTTMDQEFTYYPKSGGGKITCTLREIDTASTFYLLE